MCENMDFSISEFEGYADVAKDILNATNVLCYDGRLRMVEDGCFTREDMGVVSQIPEDGQERFMGAWFAVSGQLGGPARLYRNFENKTVVDQRMLWRAGICMAGMNMAPDSPRPGEQQDNKGNFSLVLTTVLNFGRERVWNAPLNVEQFLEGFPDRGARLREACGNIIPQNSSYTVLDVAFLKPEQMELFQSDFRTLAEFLVQLREAEEALKNSARSNVETMAPEDVMADRIKGFKYTRETVDHVHSLMYVLTALTGNEAFADVIRMGIKVDGVSLKEDGETMQNLVTFVSAAEHREYQNQIEQAQQQTLEAQKQALEAQQQAQKDREAQKQAQKQAQEQAKKYAELRENAVLALSTDHAAGEIARMLKMRLSAVQKILREHQNP